jgi:hypothetical protein
MRIGKVCGLVIPQTACVCALLANSVRLVEVQKQSDAGFSTLFLYSPCLRLCRLSSCLNLNVVFVPPLVISSPGRNIMFDVGEYIFTGIFAFEILVGITALGFVNGPTTWLRISGMNTLDFVIMIAIIIENVLIAMGNSTATVLPFRMLRTLKILSYFKMFWAIRVIVATLMIAGKQILTLIFVLIFLLLAISTLLLEFLQSNFSRSCVVLDQSNGPCVADFSTGWASSSECDFMNWQHPKKQTHSFDTPDSDFPTMIEDYYPFQRWCKIMINTTAGQYDNDPNYELDFKGRYHTCGAGRKRYQPRTEMCVEVGNPSLGLSHFDDLEGSLVTLMQGVAPDSYYDVIWRSVFSEPQASGFLLIFWIIFTVLTTWLLLGIGVSVVTGTFKV